VVAYFRWYGPTEAFFDRVGLYPTSHRAHSSRNF
jgi:hypothetical protein